MSFQIVLTTDGEGVIDFIRQGGDGGLQAASCIDNNSLHGGTAVGSAVRHHTHTLQNYYYHCKINCQPVVQYTLESFQCSPGNDTYIHSHVPT